MGTGGTESRGVKLLYSIFYGKPVKSYTRDKRQIDFYDAISYAFWQWCKDKTIKTESQLTVYAEFLRHKEVLQVCEEQFFQSPSYEVDIKRFRAAAIRHIVAQIYPEYWEDVPSKADTSLGNKDNYLTTDDISAFIGVVSKNKIWDDKAVKTAQPIIYEYMNYLNLNFRDVDPDDVGDLVVSQIKDANPKLQLDYKDDRMYYMPEFEELEKLNRKKWSPEKIHPYIDAMDLTALKLALKDPEGHVFCPKGWQGEFLLNHKRHNYIVGSRRIGKCTSENSYLIAYDGSRILAKDIKLGDKLLASDKKGYVRVEETDRFKKSSVKITYQNGMTQIVSSDHRIPTQANYSKDGWDLDIDNYIRADQLVPGEHFVPTMFGLNTDRFNSKATQYDISMAKLVGYMIGDGSLSFGNAVISVGHESQIQYVENLAAAIGKKISVNRRRTSWVIRILDFMEMRDMFPEICTTSANKIIPPRFFGASKEEVWGIIEGLFNTDGYIQVKKSQGSDGFKRKGTVALEYCSVSEQLVRDIQELCARLGLITYISTKPIRSNFKSSNAVAWYLYISDKDSLREIFNNCDLSNKLNYQECMDIISVEGYTNSNLGVVPREACRERCKFGLKAAGYNFQRWKCQAYGIEHWNNYAWMQVKSIENIGEMPVVHIKVSGDSLYRDGPVLSHNTFFGAGYLAIRQLMVPNQVIVYIVPTLKNHARPAWKAMRDYFKAYPDIKMNKSTFTIYNEATGSELYFLTSERNDSVRGSAANLLIMDEAAFVNEEIYITAAPLLTTTKGMLYAITTVNPETPKNWYYYNLIDAELSMYDPAGTYYGRRVPLEENPFIDDQEKMLIRKEGQRNYSRYQAEYECIFSDSDGFNMKNFWTIDSAPIELRIGSNWVTRWKDEALDKTEPIYGRFLVSYDAAKRKDKPAVVVYGILNDRADIVMAEYMEGMDYFDQVEAIMAIEKIFKGMPVDIVIDYGGVGVVIEEIFSKKKKKYIECIQAVSGMFEQKDGFIRRVGKDLMLAKMKTAMELGNLRAFTFMDKLRLEMETFDENDHNRKNGNHYDMVSAAYQGYWFIERMGYLVPDGRSKDQKRMDEDFEWMGAAAPETDQYFNYEAKSERGAMGKFGY